MAPSRRFAPALRPTGTVCWQISFRDGHGTDGCQQERYRGPALALNIDAAGLVLGTVSPRVATVELQLRSGERLSVEPAR
jgi:hypothetical protein